MKHHLPTFAVAIQHHAEAPLGDTFLHGDAVRHQEEVSEQSIIALLSLQERREVSPWNYQNMDRGLRVDVFESHGLVVLVDDSTG